jgi:hypothetical protein
MTNPLTLAKGYSTSQWASDFAPLPLAERTFRRTIFAAATRLSLQCLRTAVAETMPETAPESVPDMGVFSRDLLETCWMGRCGKIVETDFDGWLRRNSMGETDLWDMTKV